MRSTIRITSTGGIAAGTRVTMDDGRDVPGVLGVTIKPLEPMSILEAEVSLQVASLDLDAHPLLSLDTVREAAARHGYELVESQWEEDPTAPAPQGYRSYRRRVSLEYKCGGKP